MGDQVVGTLPLDKPLRVVAGTSVMQVRAEGFVSVSRPLVVSAGGLARETIELAPIPRVELPVRASVPNEAAAPEPGDIAAPVVAAPIVDSAARKRNLRIAGGVGLGVGLAVGALGFAAYGVRESKAANWNNKTRFGCGPSSQVDSCNQDWQAAQLAQTLEIVGLVGGGVIAAASVVLLALPVRKEGAKRAAVECGGGPGALGIACGARF